MAAVSPRFERSSKARWGALELVVSTLSLALIAYLGVQRSGFQELLGLGKIELRGEEPWLLPASILSTTLVLLVPAFVLGLGLVRLGRARASRRCFITAASLALFVMFLDLDLLRSVGRHLVEVARVALLPEGHVAGGDFGQWARMLAEWGCVAVLASAAVAWLAERFAQDLAAALSPLLRHVIGWSGGVLAIALVAAPHWMHQGWRDTGLYERLYGALLVDLRVRAAAADDAEQADPVLRSLYPRLRHAYRAAFPALGAGKPASTAPLPLAARPPNVILVVTESLRRDVFGTELMPRLTHWAEAGLTATEHDAGTIYSESGLFALLYGRSPAVFHQTLNAGVPPQFCTTLRASGYECAYFSGHPKVWMRREEFVNAQTMDHFVHDDRGSWPEWDQRALDGMVEMVSKSERPIFAIVLLMSSHFEYQYPPRYAIDLPVSNSAWHVTSPRALGPEDEVPHRNRYRNCMRFIDDVVSDAIARLDPQRNLVVFTGDHGESINDDGRYTHGYSFAEVTTRTPFAMVGPGVAPGRLQYPTYHQDVLPSLLHVLRGEPVAVPHVHGVDWFGSAEPSSALLAHSPPGERVIEAQLRTEGVRLRLDFDSRAPEVTVLGFEDAFGHLIPTPDLGQGGEDRLVQALETQLLTLRR
ncbi:MAG TPA: sulfatase-like hydrolase/transferase [Polyangiaceae bacterium]|nr:sulfatase-like hydrolase/transferase [Polyangiaceae bacterium]